MEIKKARVTIEFKINAERCKEYNITPEEVLENLRIRDSDMTDGYEIFPSIFGMDITSDFVLEPCPDIVSRELVPEESENPLEPVDVALIEKDASQGLSKEEIKHLAKRAAGTENIPLLPVDLYFAGKEASLIGVITSAAAYRIGYNYNPIRKAVEEAYDYDRACFKPGILETDKLRISIEERE